MLTFKLRAGLLALVVMLALGAYAAATASAEAGPFFHHRPVGGKGEGEKIEPKAPEGISSSPGEAFFLFDVSGTRVLILTSDTQLKGVIYNNALQGQSKIKMEFVDPEIVEPTVKECTPVIGENDTVKVFGHLVWKWNGTQEQRTEVPIKNQTPYWIFLPSELQSGATELPKGTLFSLTLKGAGCGVLAGTYPIKGNYAAAIKPPHVEEWSEDETQTLLPDGEKIHFWNGKEFVGAETRAELTGEIMTFVGELKFDTIGHQGGAAEEIARFEK
jgi:hypothetical protein